MGIFDLFSSIANNFASRYLQMTQDSSIRQLASKHTEESRTDCAAPQEETDVYEPTAQLCDAADPVKIDTLEPAAEDGDEVPCSEPDPEAAEEVIEQPYRFRHQTNLNYEVRLEFQLQAIASIAQQIADGETVSQEELVAAGFGLHAAMNISGTQSVEAGDESQALGEGHARKANLIKASNARAFSAHSRNFALESFSRESLRIKSSMDVKTGESYERAVNRFSLRYRMDNQFSFSFLNRFTVQTERFAETDPANLTDYVDSAGGVAEKGSVEMMAAFFDAVDSYLGQAEEALLARANQFFDLAAQEMGYSEDMIATARNHVTDTIESFFGRVDEAMAGLESLFLPQQPESLPPDQNLVIPEVQDYYSAPPKDTPANIAMA